MPQAQTVEMPKRLPLYSPIQTRTSEPPFTKDSRIYNAFVEYDAQIESYQIFKRVGLGTTPVYGVGTSVGNGIYTETGTANVFSIFGGTAYRYMPSGGANDVLISVDASAPYFFETVGTANNTSRYCVFGNGAAAYYVLFDTGPPFHRVLTNQITDVNFPATFAWGWCTLNGYLYAMDLSGNIWGTAGVNNPIVWSGTNVIVASSNADLGVAIAKQLNYLVAFKQYTTQVFYDAGNPPPGSPLAPVQDSQVPLGCLVGASIGQIDNTLLWITSNQTISPQIAQMDNLVPKIVSTPDIDRILDNITWTDPNPNNNVRAWVLKHAGHRFYGLNLITNNMTLVYDLDQKSWLVWTDVNGNWWPIVGTAFVAPGGGEEGIHLAQHYSNGNVYPLDGDYAFPNDYGNVFPVDIYTPNFDGGTVRRKMLSALYFGADQAKGSILQARYSDDDYSSWSNFRQVDLSLKKPRLTDEGTFEKKRAYHFRHQCDTVLRIRSVDLQMDVGTL